MSLYVGGQHGVVFFGPRSNPCRFRYWAARGLIHMEDSSDNSYDTYSVREFLLRLNSISDMLGNSRDLEGFAHWDEIKRNLDFLDAGTALANKAKEQGMPPRLFSGKLNRERFSAIVQPKARHAFS